MKTQIGCILGFSQIAAAESVEDVHLLRDEDTEAQDDILREAQINMMNYTGSPDGVIRKDEMDMLRKTLKKSTKLPDQHVEHIISLIDQNLNGEIDATEYLAYAKGLLDELPEKPDLWMERLYSAVGQKGRVSEKAMKKLHRLSEYLELLEDYDVNKDGKLSRHEVSLEERRKSPYFDEKTDEYTFEDVDEDGMISLNEFANPNEEKWANGWTKILDKNRDGKITEEDFDKMQALEDIIRQAQINMINYTGSPDGVIRKKKMNKLRKALKKSKELTDQQVEDLISKMDKNGDGEIDADEYLAYATGELGESPDEVDLWMEQLYSAVGQNGRVSKKATKKIHRLGEYLELLEDYDVNMDGKLSRHEVSLEERRKSQFFDEETDEYTFEDVDQDGMFSVNEFANPNEEKWANGWTKILDKNRDGKITEEDFDKLQALDDE